MTLPLTNTRLFKSNKTSHGLIQQKFYNYFTALLHSSNSNIVSLFRLTCFSSVCPCVSTTLQGNPKKKSELCRENGGEIIDFVEKKRLKTDVWICHLRRASGGNSRCNQEQRRACREAFTHINTRIHFFIKTKRRAGTRQRDKKNK